MDTSRSHDKLFIDDDEIIINGPPNLMRGHVSISNPEGEPLSIEELPLSQAKSEKKVSPLLNSFRFPVSLLSGEKRIQRIRQKLPADTPPGEYVSIVHVGGKQKTLRLIVQPFISIKLYPTRFHFNGVQPGKTYTSQLTLTNIGNLPFKVPAIKHNTTLDEDYLCRAMSLAIRKKGSEGFTAAMDELIKSISNEMPDWLEVKIEESGKTVEPGKSIQLHVNLVLPKDVDTNRDYFGSIRIWKKNISYHIKSD